MNPYCFPIRTNRESVTSETSEISSGGRTGNPERGNEDDNAEGASIDGFKTLQRPKRAPMPRKAIPDQSPLPEPAQNTRMQVI